MKASMESDEGPLNGFAKTVEAAIHELSHLVIGHDPFDSEILALKLFRDVYSDGGQIQGSALAAVEMACWDIVGKVCGKPLYKLIGGRNHEKLRVYANGWYRGPRTPESYYEKAKLVKAKGYTALKIGCIWQCLANRRVGGFRFGDRDHQAVRPWSYSPTFW